MLQWWRIHWGRAKHWRWQADRPYRLIAFAVLPLVIVAIAERLLANGDLKWLRDWIKESSLYGPLFFPGEEAIVWKDRLQGVILLLGLPVAFCLWYWRDRNVRDQIENSRKDINLKEFQEVQMRAAGAMDENLPEAARRQLQIAALHQLRGFLRGEYGESFRRSAFELLLAGHAAAMEEIGTDAVRAIFHNKKPYNFEKIVAELQGKLSPVARERMAIISDELKAIFLSGFPLSGRNFDLLTLKIPYSPKKLDLSRCTFLNANLRDSILVEANMRDARLEMASVVCADFRDVDFTHARLSAADMSWMVSANCSFRSANLDRANLSYAHLLGADLMETSLREANMRNAKLRGASFLGDNWKEVFELTFAKFDDSTKMAIYWDNLTIEQINAVRDEFRVLGARHDNDPAE